MRLSHLAAMATLVALLGAMFVALPSAGAQTVDPPMCGTAMTLMLAHDADADGSVESDEPQNETCTIAQAIGGNADISVSGTATAISIAGGTGADLTITAAGEGTATLKVKWTASSPTRTTEETTHKITVTKYTAAESEDTSSISPNFKISFVGDADNIVSAGATVEVAVVEENAKLTRISVSGGLDFYAHSKAIVLEEDGDDDDSLPDETGAVTESEVYVGSTVTSGHLANALMRRIAMYTTSDTDTMPLAEDTAPQAGNVVTRNWLVLEVPVGTPPGEYTVSAIGTYQRSGTTHRLVKSAMLTVGDTVEVETVTFDLSSPRRTGLMAYVPGAAPAALNPNAMDKLGGPPNGTGKDGYEDDASTREFATISVGSANNTEFSLSILNRSGKPSEASAITSIVISTTGGSLQAKADQDYECDAVRRTRACEIDISTYADAGDPLPSKIRVLLSAPETPGTAEVRAVVVAGGQVHAPDPVTITFYGPLAELSLSEPSGTLLSHNTDGAGDDRDMIKFTIDATDANGNAVRTPNVGVKITDPDGVTVSPSKYMVHRSGSLNHTLELDNDTAKASAWKTGDYEITISQGALSQKVMFAVVGLTGKDEGIDLSVDNEAPDMISAKVVATAMVTDDNGNAVADGTMVRFTSRDTTGDTDSVLVLASDRDTPTKGGEAKATFVVIGPGSAVVTASADDQVDVAVVASTAGAPEPVVEPEPEPEVASVDCLSNLSGFSTWTCGVDADVSEIFTMVSERGVTAIHLWNGTNWVRYSVVGGSEVPGSSDFMVTKTDILYISQ